MNRQGKWEVQERKVGRCIEKGLDRGGRADLEVTGARRAVMQAGCGCHTGRPAVI